MRFILLLIVALSSSGSSLTYKDTVAKYSVSYPSTWLKQELPNLRTVAFLRPKQDGDFFKENLNIVTQDLSATPLNLVQLTELIQKQAEAMQGFGKMISQKPIVFAGRNGMEMVYTLNLDPMKLKLWQMWTLKDNTAYILTYTGMEDKYETYLPQAKEIVASFKFY